MVYVFWVSVIFIIYVYFGYPIAIALLAKLFPKRAQVNNDSLPTVTLLVLAYNEEKIIAKKIENSLDLAYPRDKLQIIVAADGSSDQTPNIVQKYSKSGIELNYIPSRQGKMAAINRGVLSARGEIIILSDANNMYEPNAVKALVKPFTDPLIGATTGAKLIIEDGRELSSAEGLYWKYEDRIKKNETRLGSCTSSVGEILAIRKSCFVSPQENIINDDHYMVLDLIHRGLNVTYVPEARSLEYVSQTSKDEIVRRSRMNAGLFQTISMSRKLLPFNRPLILWEIISHKYFRAFVPFAMLLALLSNLILVFENNQQNNGLTSPPPISLAAITLIVQFVFYALALLGNTIKSTGWASRILYLPTFLVNSNLATANGLYTFLTNKQSHIWKRVGR